MRGKILYEDLTVMLTFLCRDRDRPVTVALPSRPRSIEHRPPCVPLASQSVQRPLASLSVLKRP